MAPPPPLATTCSAARGADSAARWRCSRSAPARAATKRSSSARSSARQATICCGDAASQIFAVPSPVGGEGGAEDDAGVSLEDEKRSTSGGIPHPGGPVVAARDNAPPVGREGDRPETGRVPVESDDLAAGGGIPDPGRSIATAGD